MGFKCSEKVFASQNSSFMEFALKDGKSSHQTSSSAKRKSSNPTLTPIPSKRKRTKEPVSVSAKSKSILKAFSFDKTPSLNKKEGSAAVDVDVVISSDTEERSADRSDEKIFQDAMKKLRNGEWVSGVIVKKATDMLKTQFPHLQGLQETLKSKSQLSKFKAVDFEVDSIQVHHAGGCHWVLSSSKEGNVFVYDSLYDEPTDDLKLQLLLCYKNFMKDGQLKVQYKPVSKQAGSTDCGIFVIAYAFDIASGRSPEKIIYNQFTMRAHLSTCINRRSFSHFPVVLNDNSYTKICSVFMIK
uniref:Ubiquitin-like protease family profile domain-containing protein n=1 Tax=Clytia hemisphaerica TaxID=252671 RepID=A0A7M5V3E3_9CNID